MWRELTIVSDKGNALGRVGRTATKAAVLNPGGQVSKVVLVEARILKTYRIVAV